MRPGTWDYAVLSVNLIWFSNSNLNLIWFSKQLLPSCYCKTRPGSVHLGRTFSSEPIYIYEHQPIITCSLKGTSNPRTQIPAEHTLQG